jgi:hypothetical protein
MFKSRMEEMPAICGYYGMEGRKEEPIVQQ